MTIGRLARPLVRVSLAMLTLSSSAWIASAQTHDDHVMPSAGGHKNTAAQNELVRRSAMRPSDFATCRERWLKGTRCSSAASAAAISARWDALREGTAGRRRRSGRRTSRDRALRAAAERPPAVDRRRLLVLADDWNKKHSGPPQLMGQLFHLFDSPNRFGLPAFYTLHVWAWKDNPNGTFTNWNPDVSCNAFNPDQQ